MDVVEGIKKTRARKEKRIHRMTQPRGRWESKITKTKWMHTSTHAPKDKRRIPRCVCSVGASFFFLSPHQSAFVLDGAIAQLLSFFSYNYSQMDTVCCVCGRIR